MAKVTQKKLVEIWVETITARRALLNERDPEVKAQLDAIEQELSARRAEMMKAYCKQSGKPFYEVNSLIAEKADRFMMSC